MKSFFSMFPDSASELRKTETLAVSGMLMALSIVLRNLTINISADLRINFAFIGVMAIAMLYGPVVSSISMIGVDVIGYILDGYKARDYNFGLLTAKIVAALIYGLLLYYQKQGIDKPLHLIIRASIARVLVVLICNLILNSAILYYCYTNPRFPFLSATEWQAFGVWMTPRIIKNAIMLPIEVLLVSVVLPVIEKAHKRVFRIA
jgi:ECF transporter S component (folate family)